MRISLCCVLTLTCGFVQAQDFNGNAVRDSIDLRNGAADCNTNGVPDSADISVPNFSAAVEHFSDTATLSNVLGVATLDADLDGDLDLIVSSRQGQNNSALSLWRNDGGPGLRFASRTTITNALCTLVRTADLNGDGRADVVSSDSGFGRVVVMLASGPGSFATPILLTAGGPNIGIALGDLDADNDTDIVVTCHSVNAVNVFRNNGAGGFAPRTTHAVDLQPTSVAIADITGDDVPDLAVGNSYISAGPPARPGTVSLLRGIPGGFSTLSTLPVLGHAETSLSSRPHDVGLADIDSDGDIDLLVSTKNGNSLRVFSNDGTGAFTNTQTLGPLEPIGGVADRFLCANLDADPEPELAWCDSAANAVRIYDNTAGELTLSSSFAVGSVGPVAIAAGDMTGDGITDLATAGDSSNAFSVFIGLGTLFFDAPVHIRDAESSFYPILADFTGDGITDLGSYATFDNPASFRYAPGIGGARFGEIVSIPLSTAGSILPRDINHDGHLDLLSVGGHCFVKFSNGDGTFGPEISSNLYVYSGSTHTSDINNDGHLDLLWVWSANVNVESFVRISFGDGQGHFGPYFEVRTPRWTGSVWTGDLSGDGAPELFVGLGGGALGDLARETFIVYPNNGTGSFGDFTPYAYELAPNFLGAVGNFAWVDIDGDGDNDLLASSSGYWLYRNIGNQLAPPILLGGFANFTRNEFGPTITDIDADGDLDFYGTAAISGIVSPAAYFNHGSGEFGPRAAFMRYRNSIQHFAVGDADNNGMPDALIKPEGYRDWYLHLTRARHSLDRNANAIPDDCEPGFACDPDANCDGSADQGDVACLVLAIAGDASCLCEGDGDFNADGSADQGDLADLIRVIAGGTCP